MLSLPFALRFRLAYDARLIKNVMRIFMHAAPPGRNSRGEPAGPVRRTISLDVSLPQGDLRVLLRLAVKGTPFMEGQIFLKTKIDIPYLWARWGKS